MPCLRNARRVAAIGVLFLLLGVRVDAQLPCDDAVWRDIEVRASGCPDPWFHYGWYYYDYQYCMDLGGMSRRLLKFGGGSSDDYATWRSPSTGARPS